MNLDVLRNIKEPVFYITNDVGKGIGLENVLPNYHIICLDDHPLVDILQRSGVSVFCLERVLGKRNVLFRNSGLILSHPAVLSFVKEKSTGFRPNILFFKPQRKIEIVAKKNGFNLLGNLSTVSHCFEDKLAFFELCQKAGIKVPQGEVLRLSEARFADLAKKYKEPLVFQFGRGWAGNSTFFVENEKEVKKLQKDFGGIKIKVNRFIKGRTFLNNAVIYGDKVVISEPAVQIKAESILTSTRAGTGGRQWPTDLASGQKAQIRQITKEVAELMKKKNFRGFFGLDFLEEERTKEIYLSENNARLTASTPFYTKLELKNGAFPLLGYHLLSFLPKMETLKISLAPPEVLGSEIVARNTLGTKAQASGSFWTGIYGHSLKFRGESAYLDSETEGDFWLETVASGRMVNPEIEIAKIDTFSSVCDSDGNLKQEYIILLRKIKVRLNLERCGN